MHLGPLLIGPSNIQTNKKYFKSYHASCYNGLKIAERDKIGVNVRG